MPARLYFRGSVGGFGMGADDVRTGRCDTRLNLLRRDFSVETIICERFTWCFTVTTPSSPADIVGRTTRMSVPR